MNSKFFHSLINWIRKSDSVVGLVMDGSWVEDPEPIKQGVQLFFEEKFSCHLGIVGNLLMGLDFRSSLMRITVGCVRR